MAEEQKVSDKKGFKRDTAMAFIGSHSSLHST